jgi:2,3-bisphosphoglycerate-dependent phosphoglycerate mutase
MTSSRHPRLLWIARHGESAGNVARDTALRAGTEVIEVSGRDMDVPLSALGEEQAHALGRWFGALGPERPDVILASPYFRAKATAEAVKEHCAADAMLIIDERLREKEFGALDRLTKSGIEARYPAEAESRADVGKFYYRPPSGESWCDVILRLRSAFESICLHYPDKRVLIISHQVVVLCFRYLIEKLDEKTVLAIDAQGDVANCAITEYQCTGEGDASDLVLRRYNFMAPLQQEGTPVTVAPDVAAGT